MPEPRKPKADFSDVTGRASSTDDATRSAAQQEYTVVQGDSLSKIAGRFYGDVNQWRRIYDANRDQVKDPDRIHPGQTLRIPAK